MWLRYLLVLAVGAVVNVALTWLLGGSQPLQLLEELKPAHKRVYTLHLQRAVGSVR
ncbi:hypothetical protein P154DRAFT_526976 [Amniculicola lignicola CBS 123094]|uniref:Uncharacterized protein n=1 Tax=Amniculicola lignicola CBS 123094 TaxID=1392246 RepID=A0A6A5W029_9PLEO|nr:hypothetical protein P154DRAFT_526976 [Amniculicola lignicola CBS 123094]